MNAPKIKESNRSQLGLMGEKIVSHYLSSLGFQIELLTDPYSSIDIKATKDGIQKNVQVKCLTPYFVKNKWSVSLSKTGQNVENVFRCDLLYLISLPAGRANKKFAHKTDGCLLEIDVKKLNVEDHIDESGAFYINRDLHSHVYKIIRALTPEEKQLIKKYPTSTLS
jgi:hypothetical protein